MTSPVPSVLLLCGALAAGCSSTVAGDQTLAPDAGFQGFPDAEPQADAGPADAGAEAQPCVEGLAQATDPATGTCYLLFGTLSTWDAAQAACLGVGATLVIVDDAAEQSIVAGLSASFPVDAPDLWLGATDAALENSFVWIDGSPMVFDSWRDGEPNNNGPGELPENCVVIEGDTALHEWDDRSCETPAPYICERAP